MNNLAVNIASIQPRVDSENGPPIFGERLQSLGEKAQRMLRNSLESLMNMDTARAREVLAADYEADLATNIAEDTIYTVEGKIVRHNRV